MPSSPPVFQIVSPQATPEEVAAIVAALGTALAGRTAPAVATLEGGARSEWVRASRLGARRAGLSRGSWRLSGRIGRRARA